MAEMFITFAVLATLATLAVSNVNQSSQRSAVQTEKSRLKSDKELNVGAPSGSIIDKPVTTSAVAADSRKARARYNTSS